MGRWTDNFSRDGIRALLDRKNFKPESLRGFLLGMSITTTVGEVSTYKLIKQDVDAGEAPHYLPGLMIVVFAIFEALLAPFLSWWGFHKRRKLLIWTCLIVTVSSISWFFLPSAGDREILGLCSTTLDIRLFYEGMSARSIARLVVGILTCVIFILARVICFCHGVAYIDEYAPEKMSLHYGTIISGRVLGLVLGYKVMTGAMDSKFILHVVILLVGFAVNVIQIPFIIPKVVPEVDGVQKLPVHFDERSFVQSLGRVLSNSVAMMQVFAMGLMAAALWGYGYYDSEIVKVKFNLFTEEPDQTAIVIYHFVILAVVTVGVQQSAPILMEYCKSEAIKKVIIMSVASTIIYIVLTTVPRCDRGEVVGLGQSYYGHPICSLSCNCNPNWQEFKPVCMVENMVTYLSPCQAGCANSSLINGVQVYSSCTCSPNGRVILGACSDVSCTTAYRLHSVLFTLAVTFGLLVFQSQGVLLLRLVDPRDKSMVLGLMWSAVAMIAFVSGTLIIYGIQVMTCSWYGGNMCLLQKQSFPYYVGGMSATLAFLSTVISIVSSICIRMFKKVPVDRNEDDAPIPLI